jgi:hypothetical protein
MQLTANEARFLTALIREQNQTGCRGPAHDLLRQHAYPRAPHSGPDSLAFSYDAVPLTSLLLKDCADLQQIDDFLRKGDLVADPEWPCFHGTVPRQIGRSPTRLGGPTSFG